MYIKVSPEGLTTLTANVRAKSGEVVGGEITGNTGFIEFANAKVTLQYDPVKELLATVVYKSTNFPAQPMTDQELAAYVQYQISKLDSGTPPAPPEPETGALATAMDDIMTTVALVTPSATAIIGSIVRIGTEDMTVTDASNPSSLMVARGANGTTVAPHDLGAAVTISFPPIVTTKKSAPAPTKTASTVTVHKTETTTK